MLDHGSLCSPNLRTFFYKPLLLHWYVYPLVSYIVCNAVKPVKPKLLGIIICVHNRQVFDLYRLNLSLHLEQHHHHLAPDNQENHVSCQFLAQLSFFLFLFCHLKIKKIHLCYMISQLKHTGFSETILE